MNHLANELNFEIGKSFIKKNKTAIVRISIQINMNLKLYLKSKYNFNGRFKTCDNFLYDLNIIQKHFYSQNDFIELKVLKIRIQNEKAYQ